MKQLTKNKRDISTNIIEEHKKISLSSDVAEVMPILIQLMNKKSVTFAIMLFLAIFPAYSLFHIIHDYSVNVFVIDDLDVISFIQKLHYNQLSFADFWEQHNEHRVLFPFCFIYLTTKLYHWNNVTFTYETFAISCGSLLLLAVIYYRLLTGWYRIAGFLLSSFLLFSISQYANWLVAFQLQWMLTVLCLFAAIIKFIPSVGAQEPINKIKSIILAIIPTVIASYSLASGLCLWVIALLFMLVTYRYWGRIPIIIWTVSASLVISLYLYKLEFGRQKFQIEGPTDKMYLLKHPINYIKYICIYLGGSFNFNESISTSIIIGIAGILLAVGCLVILWRLHLKTKNDYLTYSSLWCMLILFGFANAAITGIIRCSMGLIQALSSRYTTMSNIFWIGLIGLSFYLLSIVMDTMPKFTKRLTIILFSIITFCFIGLFFHTDIYSYNRSLEQCTFMSKALINQLELKGPVNDTYYGIYPDPAGFYDRVSAQRRLHEGPYCDSRLPTAVQHYSQAMIYYKNHQYPSAVDEFIKAENGLDNFAELHLYLARCYQKTGDPDKSKQELDTTFKLDPRYSLWYR